MLEIQSLYKSFGNVLIAKDLNLFVPVGQLLGILGPNGAGKSSLFNIISGLVKADRGELKLGGQSITKMSVSQRARYGIGRSFQIPQPFDGMTVYENLLAASTHGGGLPESQAAESCAQILEQTGLIGQANHQAGRLPLLDRKRLEMARAMATQPKVLLLDEIAGGLTEAEYESLIVTIQDIKLTGITILWIEHVVNALFAVADRLIVINEGLIIADGNPEEVMNHPEVQVVYLGMSL